ncbi:MAG: VOC family protein [Candidatus Dormibacteria bacterium]
MVLTGAPLVAFLATTDAARAKGFYEGTLGLTLIEETPFALTFDCGGTTLRVTPVAHLAPQPFTVAGWRVDDIARSVGELKARGVAMQRYEGVDQDDLGVWRSPSGARIAWFQDPDGNTLSLTQVS